MEVGRKGLGKFRWENNSTFQTYLQMRLKPGFHMISNGRRRSAITIGNQSASCPRNVVWDSLRHTIRMIGRVELDSTFPTIMTTPTKKDSKWERESGTVCNNW